MMMLVGSIGVLHVVSLAALCLAMRLALRHDRAFRERGFYDVLSFDLARAMGITFAIWVATTTAMLVEPSIGAVPLAPAGRYTMAATTALLFTGVGLGAVSFLAFRLRHVRGAHEWQRAAGAC